MRLIVLLLLIGAPAGADEGGDVEIAKTRFMLGDLLYRGDHYREAVDEFEAARKLAPRPDLDYNIARCYERLREWDRALEAYTRYVESTPTPLDAEQMLTHMDEIKQLRASEPKQAGQAAPRRPSVPHDTRAPRITGLVLAGVGLVGLGVGVAFAVAANGTAEQLTLLDRSRQPFDPSREHDLSTQRALEYTFLGVGGAALAAGIVTFTIGHVSERRSRATVAASGSALRVDF